MCWIKTNISAAASAKCWIGGAPSSREPDRRARRAGSDRACVEEEGLIAARALDGGERSELTAVVVTEVQLVPDGEVVPTAPAASIVLGLPRDPLDQPG